MKIGLVHPRLDHRGGAENVLSWMARSLIERGHEVVVATGHFSPERWRPEDWSDVPLVVLGSGSWDRLKTRPARERGVGRRLRRVFGGCELIVAHNSPAPLWATVAARSMRRRTRVVWYCEEPKARLHWRTTLPTIASALDEISRYPWAAEPFRSLAGRAARYESRRRYPVDRRLDAEAARNVDLILANSAFTARNAERVFGRPVVPCPLGAPIPPPAAKSPSEAYVAWITSPVVHKNVHGFLEAVRIAVKDGGAPDLRLRVVGLDRDHFGPLAARMAIAEALDFETWISDADLNDLIAGCRLLAYPTIDEPFGLVPLHAMAHGRAVLTTRSGGPAETVVDGVTGALANPMDPHDMARRLVELWRDPARCDALGAAGRERYLAHFTFERFMDRFERLVFDRSAASLRTPPPAAS